MLNTLKYLNVNIFRQKKIYLGCIDIMVESLTRGVTGVRYFLQNYIVNNTCVKHRLPSKMTARGNPSDVIRKGFICDFKFTLCWLSVAPRLESRLIFHLIKMKLVVRYSLCLDNTFFAVFAICNYTQVYCMMKQLICVMKSNIFHHYLCIMTDIQC